MLKEIKSPQTLKLSFDFEITKHEERIIHLRINKLLRELKYNNKTFIWFMEDLVVFLDSNKYQRRWDYGKIIVSGIENMNFSKEDKEDFKSKFKLITSWDMEWI